MTPCFGIDTSNFLGLLTGDPADGFERCVHALPVLVEQLMTLTGFTQEGWDPRWERRPLAGSAAKGRAERRCAPRAGEPPALPEVRVEPHCGFLCKAILTGFAQKPDPTQKALGPHKKSERARSG